MNEPVAWLLGAAGGLVVLGAAASVISRGARWMFTTVRRLGAFLDEWNGEPARPGHERKPGIPERLVSIERRVKAVEEQVTPNGGGSMRDQVDRIAEATVQSGGN